MLKQRPNKRKLGVAPEVETAKQWIQRLLLRRYRFPPSGETEQDLAVRIDHAGVGFFFPLGTPDPEAAAVKAHKIHETVVKEGWEAVCRRFARELMVGFEWCSNPVMWTYTTIHTLINQSLETSDSPVKTDCQRVLLVESDDGIRRALTWCINQQPGSACVTCDSPETFSQVLTTQKPQMVLLNRNLAERLSFSTPGQAAMIQDGVLALTYSVCVDGDQLFISTPGGSEGYLLKRVPPNRLLDPVAEVNTQPNLSTVELLLRVKSFFKVLVQTHSNQDSSGLAKLTRREREVMVLLSKGCVDKEIAQAMGISVWTVHGHIKSIFERLHVRTRTEAVVRYLEK
jgi:DNA-binding NarL/FixJ family response regulator